MKRNTKDRSGIIFWVVIAILLSAIVGVLKWAAPYMYFIWLLMQ